LGLVPQGRKQFWRNSAPFAYFWSRCRPQKAVHQRRALPSTLCAGSYAPGVVTRPVGPQTLPVALHGQLLGNLSNDFSAGQVDTDWTGPQWLSASKSRVFVVSCQGLAQNHRRARVSHIAPGANSSVALLVARGLLCDALEKPSPSAQAEIAGLVIVRVAHQPLAVSRNGRALLGLLGNDLCVAPFALTAVVLHVEGQPPGKKFAHSSCRHPLHSRFFVVAGGFDQDISGLRADYALPSSESMVAL